MRQRLRGFTLVELMVVVVILGVLATIAIPGMRSFLRSSARSDAVNTFMADVRFARSEAMRRGGSVVMCRSDAPEAAAPVCSSGSGPGGNGWVSGWLVFHDLNSDGNKDASDPVLRLQAALTSMDSMTEPTPATNKLQFVGSGRLRNLNSVLTMQVGGNDNYSNTEQRTLCINLGGRVRIAGDGNASCGGS